MGILVKSLLDFGVLLVEVSNFNNFICVLKGVEMMRTGRRRGGGGGCA